MSATAHDVVVVGSGLVGLACAYSLASHGLHPLVLEAEEPGAGASSGNAGWISVAPGIVAPVPAPGVVRTSLSWLVQQDSPLRLAPRVEWEYLRWLTKFARSCSREAATAGLRATLALNERTGDLFDRLERDGLDFEMKTPGVLMVYKRCHSFDAARQKLHLEDGRGPRGRVLTRDEALAAEPLLNPRACVGAIRYETDRQVRPDMLIDALVRRLDALGVEIRSRTPCVRVIRSGARVVGVETPDEIVRGRAYVLAAGIETAGLARQVGLRVPVEGGRGYSFDVRRGDLPVRTPVYVYDGRLALTPFDDFTRVVGMMELGARRPTVRPGGVRTMNRVGRESFREWPGQSRTPWAGIRPMTPDGLPVIGSVPGLENLCIAGGHGMLGVTLSLRTGDAIAEIIRTGDNTDPILRPFTPARFA